MLVLIVGSVTTNFLAWSQANVNVTETSNATQQGVIETSNATQQSFGELLTPEEEQVLNRCVKGFSDIQKLVSDPSCVKVLNKEVYKADSGLGFDMFVPLLRELRNRMIERYDELLPKR